MTNEPTPDGEAKFEGGESLKPEKEKKTKHAKDKKNNPEKAKKAAKAGKVAEKKSKKKDPKPGKKAVAKGSGITSIGIDYSLAPELMKDHFMFIDETGRLCFSAQGAVSFVSLTPQSEVELEEDCQ